MFHNRNSQALANPALFPSLAQLWVRGCFSSSAIAEPVPGTCKGEKNCGAAALARGVGATQKFSVLKLLGNITAPSPGTQSKLVCHLLSLKGHNSHGRVLPHFSVGSSGMYGATRGVLGLFGVVWG